MAFYEEIGKKLSKTGQDVAQKTKNLAEIARLNSSIGELEREITSQYMEIGKAYYQKNSTDSGNPEIDVYVQKISENTKKIDVYREQIRRLKGVRRCENCGEEIDAAAVFCSNCGAKVVIPVRVSERQTCPKCGYPAIEEQSFCTNCGQKLDLYNSCSENNTDSNMESKKQKVCSGCGSECEWDEMFCSQCGRKL